MSDNSFENSLKCDFPARESFREALLEDLLAIEGQEAKRAPSGALGGKRKEAARVIKLGDDDLEMLAAAEGEQNASVKPLDLGDVTGQDK